MNTNENVCFPFEEIRPFIQADTQELFGLISQGGTIGIYMSDNLPLYFISDQLLNYLGFSLSEFTETFESKLINTILEEEREGYFTQLTTAYEQNSTFQYMCHVKNRSGETLLVRDFGKRLSTPDSSQLFLIIRSEITQLMTRQKDLERKVALLNDRVRELETFTSNIPGGVCEIMLDDCYTLVYGNDGFYQLYGYTPEQFKEELHNHIVTAIHPKDREYVKNVIYKAALDMEPVFEFEHRITHRNGTICWILVRGSFSYYQQSPLLNCVIIDITNRKTVEEEARISERRFRIALSKTDNSIFEYDIPSKVMIHGDRSAGNYGLQNITGNVPYSLLENGTVHLDTAEVFLEMYRKIREGEPTASCLVKVRLKDGYYAWRKISMTTIYDENNEAIQAIGFLEDVDEQVRLEEHLRYQSERDPLTGLYNRRAMERKIRQELTERPNTSVAAMIIIDLDDFKNINDSYGHMFGDFVLGETAERITSLFRRQEAIGRIGGDEFMAFISLLPSESVALSCGNRIAGTFQTCFSDSNVCATVSCSIGIATFPHDGNTFEELYRKADIALYEAKKSGKNQVIAYSAEMSAEEGWIPFSNTNIDSSR